MSKKPLLSLQNLSITATKPLISEGNMTLHPGEIIALMGENGAGKTTLGLSVMGLIDRKSWTLQGKIYLKGQNVLDLNGDEWAKIRGKDVGFVFQDPLRSFNPLKTIEAHFLESIALHESLSKEQALLKIQNLLISVGLNSIDRFLKAYPFQLSGGEGQRIAIALSLVHSPSLLILDEPTSSLDQKSANDIMTFLKKWARANKAGLLLITHDHSLVKDHADRLFILDQTLLKEIKKASLAYKRKQTVRASRERAEVSLLKASHMGVAFSEKTVLSGLNFSLGSQKIVGIFGDNGAGKTTLAKALVGLMPFTGQLLWKGKETRTLSREQRLLYAKSVQMVFQNPLSSFNPKMTLFQSMTEGVKLHYPMLSEAERQQKIESALQDVSLNRSYANRYPETLSGGEIQKAAIARVLAMAPELIILDEPTASLDQRSISLLADLIQNLYRDKNISFMIISHQKAFLMDLCQEVFELNEGRITLMTNFRSDKS